MGKIGLMIKASLKNVDQFYPFEPEQFCWPLKIRCTGCGEEDQNWHLISEDEVVELSNSQAHFLYKCKCCSRENYLTIMPVNQLNSKNKGEKKNINSTYLREDDEKFKTVIGFDCRGLELVDFVPRDGWAVQSGKKVFTDVDLSEKEWFEYNDVDGLPVEITNFEHKFVSLKPVYNPAQNPKNELGFGQKCIVGLGAQELKVNNTEPTGELFCMDSDMTIGHMFYKIMKWYFHRFLVTGK